MQLAVLAATVMWLNAGEAVPIFAPCVTTPDLIMKKCPYLFSSASLFYDLGEWHITHDSPELVPPRTVVTVPVTDDINKQ